ncbi:hypothetical protein [Arsukibacterium sp.]|uniref:hypothetical protein n=1 Tax=Arsukibacterium sp. TaxID=1977258 RepID=UPI00299EAC36|nr:hypothetical protein [Arsukibacterium sp.]MDX1676456.1 hypothetical protein [Arsukibacterium sp.]
MNIRNMLCQITVWFLVSLLLSTGNVQAQEKEMLAEMWQMTPKAGMNQAFENNFKAHIEHRQKLGDPRQWHVYTPVLGDELNKYLIRSCCFEWKEMDSYQQWVKEKDPMTHWNKNVDDKVAHYGHYLAVMDMANSHWPDGVTANYVGVTYYMIKPGHGSEVKAAVKIISDVAKAHNWPYHWSWSYTVSGEPGMHLAIPFENYAGMAPPEQKFNALMVKHLGGEDKAKAFWQTWASHFDKTSYNIYYHNKALSVYHKK